MRHLTLAALAAVALAAAAVPVAPVEAGEYSGWTDDALRQNCDFQAAKAKQRQSAKNYQAWAVVGHEFRQEQGRRMPYCEVLATCRRSAFYGTPREKEGKFYTSKPGDPWYQPGDPIDAWLSHRTWTNFRQTEDLRCCNNGRLEPEHTRC